MRYLLCLILFIGVLSFSYSENTPSPPSPSIEAREISYIESTSNPPLSAIENYGCNTSGFITNYSIYPQKRLGIQFIARYPSSLLLVKLPLNNVYRFLDKGTSLFSLYHFTQSLIKVFLI